jgi:allantoinase
MAYDLIIHNALLVDETGAWRGAVAALGGRIAALFAGDPDGPADETLDAGGLPVLPGLIDAHVHFNDPGRADWEGFEAGSMSAAAGGITTVLDMPLNNRPAVVDGPTLAAKRDALAGRSVVDYALWGGLVEGRAGTLAAQDAAGAVAYKAFMSASGIEDFPAVSDGTLLDGLRHAARSGRLVGVHAESEALTAHFAARLRAAGRTDRRAWLDARPPLAELDAIARALRLAREARARLHIVHVSTAEGVDLVEAARRAASVPAQTGGQPVSCETCPHYLTLDDNDFVALGPDAKCAPPLRPRATVEALWQRVLAGAVDLIASDHSPCPTADKRRGDADIWAAWGGISGVQLLLPLLLTEGVYRRGLTLPQLVRLTSAAPARLFGLQGKGALRPGADADFTLIDPDAEWTVEPSRLFSRHTHTPYAGRRLRGRVLATVVRGRVVFRDGAIIAAPGWGRLLTGWQGDGVTG